MELNYLYDIAEENNIAVCERRLSATKCFSIMDTDGDCAIAIDTEKLCTKAEEKVAIGHDVGHCLTGSFYNRYSPFDERKKYENQANKKAAYMLIPLDELISAFDSPWNSVYDLAEHFGVTEDFMRETLKIYENDIRGAT
jgi:Zn-dependent peptidase ImmA (M78 family)